MMTCWVDWFDVEGGVWEWRVLRSRSIEDASAPVVAWGFCRTRAEAFIACEAFVSAYSGRLDHAAAINRPVRDLGAQRSLLS